jgi:integrase
VDTVLEAGWLMAKVESSFSVLHLVLDSGERLPCLVDATTWIPARVALRWAMRYRRYRVQSSTLAANLRVLAKVYRWTQEIAGFDLDDRLTQGRTLQNREIESLTRSFRGLGTQELDTGAFDQHLAILEDFLKWSLDSENRGGRKSLELRELAQERNRIELVLRSLRSGARAADRIEPLEDTEIHTIRNTIGPRRDAQGLMTFPKAFSPHTRLRNWLMFEVALELGIRRGELLKLRLDSLPRGADDGIRILRRPDDPHDSRSKEPAVKTAERVIPASRNLLAAIRAYLSYPQPMGRVSGKSPYLFVARSGSPASMDTADDVISAIGGHSGVLPLSWHRLRHTWAERMAEAFAGQPNGMDRLVYLGGWTNPHSATRYIQRALARQAKEAVRSYHRTLYREVQDA